MNFWIVAALMIVLAVLIVTLPLIRKPKIKAQPDREKLNIDIARERMAELDAEYEQGLVDAVTFESARSELEYSLHSDIHVADADLKIAAKPAWGVALAVLIFVPTLSFSMYKAIGSPELSAPGAGEAPQVTQAEIEQMVSNLRTKLEAQPDNLTGWVMLGRSYMMMQRFEDAAYAMGRANDLSPGDPEVMLPLADATAMTQGGKLDGKPTELVNQVLEQDPRNVMALWLAGTAAKQAGDDATAIEHWSRLEPLLPQGSEDRTELRKVLAEMGVELAPLEPEVAAGGAEAITVTVELDPAMKDKVAPGDLVFIYAKAMTGPPMPLAAVRKTVADLPLTLTLDDSMAMTPQLKLSQFQEMKVGARITKSGQPVAQSGDVFGELEAIKPGATVSVSINAVVP